MQREDFTVFYPVTTRWMDNDVYEPDKIVDAVYCVEDLELLYNFVIKQ